MRGLSIAVLTAMFIIALAGAQPAIAGKRLVYQPNGQQSLSIAPPALVVPPMDPNQTVVVCNTIPEVGDRFIGTLYPTLDGHRLCALTGDHSWVFALGVPDSGTITVYVWKEDGNPIPEAIPTSITTNQFWFLVEHGIESYYTTVDKNGHEDKNLTAAPAIQFRLVPLAPPTAATTDSGSPMTPSQLDSAVKDSYNQGVAAGQSANEDERKQLLAKLQQDEDEITDLKGQLASGKTTFNLPDAPLFKGVARLHLDSGELMPSIGSKVVAIKVGDHVELGQFLGFFKVTQVLPDDQEYLAIQINGTTSR